MQPLPLLTPHWPSAFSAGLEHRADVHFRVQEAVREHRVGGVLELAAVSEVGNVSNDMIEAMPALAEVKVGTVRTTSAWSRPATCWAWAMARWNATTALGYFCALPCSVPQPPCNLRNPW